jgi:hypothetical protein
MKIEIVNEEGKKEEIDIVFMLKEKIVDEHQDEWDYEPRMRERENFYTFTDQDVAVLAFATVISQEAEQKSRRPEYFQQKDIDDFVFETEARRVDVDKLERALYKQHILGLGEDEPDIISLWNEQKENDDWGGGFTSCHEFMEILRAYDTTIDEQEELDNARGLLIQMFENHDWQTKSTYKDCIRTVRLSHGNGFYKRTMQMIILRNMWTTVDNWLMQVEDVKWHRYSNSEQGKKEIAEREERHRDMMTYMGESGLSSYSVDSNGTYTMWRD